MNWKSIHRWLGLWVGGIAMVVGITGAILAFFPVRDAALAMPPDRGLPAAVLAQRVADHIPGLEEIRRLPAGDFVAYSFDGNQARATRIDPANGQPLDTYVVSPTERWVRNLHRSLLLDDAGRLTTAAVALVMLLLCASGVILLVRRQGGWRQLAGRIRGTPAQRVHGWSGRVLVAMLGVSSITALYMSATTFGLVPADFRMDAEVVSVASNAPDLRPADITALQNVQAASLRKLNLPSADDPQDAWSIVTDAGEGRIDRKRGVLLAWEPAGVAQRIYDLAYALHTGQGLWLWALLLGFSGLSLPLFWGSGLLIWRNGHRRRPKLAGNVPLTRADTAIFVASEGGTTWGFAQALRDGLVRAGHHVHTATLESFATAPGIRNIFILAATYGDGQPPMHADRAVQRIRACAPTDAQVAVLGFGDRQFPSFCGYAQDLDRVFQENGWAQLLPFEGIHQQSAQAFTRWVQLVAQTLGESIEFDYTPRLPRTVPLRLVARRDYPGDAGSPAAILRFQWSPHGGWLARLTGRGMPFFEAGDLVGIVPPGEDRVPRYYSLASGYRDRFLEICVGRVPGGQCSGYLHGLSPGDTIQAFIRKNEGFTLQRSHRPTVLIGAGTGIAPLAGFIRGNARRAPMYLYFGMRNPTRDFYFDDALKTWLHDRRLSDLQTTSSRVPGGGYVQDMLRRDASRLRSLLAKGASLRVCGSRPMAKGVSGVLDEVLREIGLSVQQLRVQGRYAEDVF